MKVGEQKMRQEGSEKEDEACKREGKKRQEERGRGSKSQYQERMMQRYCLQTERSEC